MGSLSGQKNSKARGAHCRHLTDHLVAQHAHFAKDSSAEHKKTLQKLTGLVREAIPYVAKKAADTASDAVKKARVAYGSPMKDVEAEKEREAVREAEREAERAVVRDAAAAAMKKKDKSLREKQSQLEAALAHVDNLEKAVLDSNNAHDKLKTKIHKTENNLANREKQDKLLQGQLKDISKTVTRLEQSNTKLEKAIETERGKRLKVEQDLEGKKEKCETAERALAAEKQKCADAEQKCSDAVQALDAAAESNAGNASATPGHHAVGAVGATHPLATHPLQLARATAEADYLEREYGRNLAVQRAEARARVELLQRGHHSHW